MSEKFLCVMAGFDEKSEQTLTKLQNTLYDHGFVGNQTKDIPLHITLGMFDVSQENEIYELVKRVSKNNPSFDITFNHIGIFGGSNVLFIAPDNNRELLCLKENFGDSYDWTPHITMLIDKPEQIYQSIPILSNYFHKFEGRVNKLYLYEFWPTRFILSETLVME
ncbi:MAG: 2-5 ligase [Herbinix sp.]|jgi:2'-5' RNA ligase|nr:2-5 ligase [Herbinix sp.]